ncbi:O-antigen ligase family protein [Novosphingobium sp. RD2P27]|uniref:O-antigen ligase family protein n=1 Tax=Novosphingobium kalidii TaxID=3230299 RepID=A0ABV2D004_9SPHN
MLEGDKNVLGCVYIGFEGFGWLYGKPAASKTDANIHSYTPVSGVPTSGIATAPSVRLQRPSFSHVLRGALPFLCALTVTVGLAFNGLNSATGQAVVAILGGGMLLTLLLAERPEEQFWRERKPVLVPAVLAFAWVCIGALGVTVSDTPMPLAPDFAATSLLSWLGSFAALVCGSILGMKRVRSRKALELVTFFIGMSLLAGLILHFLDQPSRSSAFWAISRQGRFAGLIGNVNVTAAVACGTIILALMMSANRLQQGNRSKDMAVALAGFAIAGIALVAAFLTAARFPIVAVMALGVLTLFLTTRTARGRGRKTYRFGLVFAALACAIGLTSSELLLTRFEAIGTEVAVRSLMWQHYVSLVLEAPIQGYGPGSFPALNAASLDNPVLGKTLWYVNSAHNIVLQLALEGGLPYLALMFLAGLRIARDVLPLIWSGRMSIVFVGVFAMSMQILVCALVDIALDVPASIFLAMFLTGLLWGRGLRLHGRSALRPRMPGNG